MNRATRCPACGTVFRVVPDQLKVSEGWVRCGRCSEVFDAAQRLFELDSAATVAGASPAPVVVAPETSPQASPQAPPQALPEIAREAAAAAPDVAAAAAAPTEATPDPAPALAAQTLAPQAAEPSDGSSPPPSAAAPLGEDTEQGEWSEWSERADGADVTDTGPAARTPIAGEAQATPEFVRRAERAAHWQHPARRGLLLAAALLLASTLAAQLALHYRDALAANWPATRWLLQAGCDALGCRIEAPRQIQSLGVDSSALARLPDSTLYRLSLVVHNKASAAVRMPAVELTMTDTQGHIVVRRVLSAAELGQPVEQLPGGGELALQATLDLGAASVAGYSVELFYP